MSEIALKISGYILSTDDEDFDIENITELLEGHGFMFVGHSDIVDYDESEDVPAIEEFEDDDTPDITIEIEDDEGDEDTLGEEDENEE